MNYFTENRNYWMDSRTVASQIRAPYKIIKSDSRSTIVEPTDYFYDFIFERENLLDNLLKFISDGFIFFTEDSEWKEPELIKYLEEAKSFDKIDLDLDFLLEKEFSFKFTGQTKYEVCGTCSGSGKVVNPSIDASGLTREDFYEDPDFAEDYFSGTFDITCPECNGERVVPQIIFPEYLNKLIENFNDIEYQNAYDYCRDQAYGY